MVTNGGGELAEGYALMSAILNLTGFVDKENGEIFKPTSQDDGI